jgi:MFS family permease
MAMFVLVVDTSLMNVSIAAVVRDLDTTASGVQSAIALEALVSAAFILIGSKVGDLFGRKRAYVLGLLGYAVGALAMAFAQGLTAIIIFWAMVGGLGASLLLPAMQSLIHGNFEGAAQVKSCSRWSSSRSCCPASGSSVTRPTPGLGASTPSARCSPSWAWAASCSASWCGRKGASPSPRSWRSGRSAWLGWSSGSRGTMPIVPRADSGWYLLVPLVIAGSGLGLLVSQLNNYTLAPISEERVSEAAGVNSAGGSFGLSFGLAFAGAIMLATLSITFTTKAEASTVLAPAQKQQVANALEEDAQILSNTQLQELLAGQPEQVQDEIVRINTDARPLALQVALLVPILAGVAGLLNSFRMMRLPEIKPSGSVEGMTLG